MTFSDNDYGSGKSYESAGFTFISETGARLRYISTTDPANDRYSWMIAKGFDHSNNKTVIARDANSKKLKSMIPKNISRLNFLIAQIMRRDISNVHIWI